MTVKDDLRQLVDALSDQDAAEALDYLRWVLAEEDALTPAEQARMEAGRAEIARGESVAWEDLKRDPAQ
jgi:hypothetical protein